MSGNHRTCESENRRARIHHASPLAEFGLGFGVGPENVCDRCGWETDDGTGEGAEDDDEADGAAEVFGQRPEDDGEEGRDGGDEAMHVECSEEVAEVGRCDPAQGRGGVHDGEEPECFHGLLRSFVGKSRIDPYASCRGAITEPFGNGPLFEIEEDGVESKEEECDRCYEPGVGSIAECMCVHEYANLEPALGFPDNVFGVGRGQDSRETGGQAYYCRYVPSCNIEAVLLDEEFRHHGIQ